MSHTYSGLHHSVAVENIFFLTKKGNVSWFLVNLSYVYTWGSTELRTITRRHPDWSLCHWELRRWGPDLHHGSSVPWTRRNRQQPLVCVQQWVGHGEGVQARGLGACHGKRQCWRWRPGCTAATGGRSNLIGCRWIGATIIIIWSETWSQIKQ